MDRFPVLVRNLVGVVIIAALFALIDFGISNLIVSIGYFATLLYFLFRTETIPTSYTNVPAVDYYIRNRYNRFNYLLLAYAIVSAVIFAIVTVNTGLPFGIVPLVSWIGFVVFILWYKKKFPEEMEVRNMMIDYITQQLRLQNIQINPPVLKQIVEALNVGQPDIAQQYANTNNIPPEIYAKIQQLVQAYQQGIQEDLSREEIEEIN